MKTKTRVHGVVCAALLSCAVPLAATAQTRPPAPEWISRPSITSLRHSPKPEETGEIRVKTGSFAMLFLQ
jgi:hypothetical protein